MLPKQELLHNNPGFRSVEYSKTLKLYSPFFFLRAMLIIGVMFGFGIVNATDELVQANSLHVSRINQGLYFQHVGASYFTNDQWHHSFAFDIPERMTTTHITKHPDIIQPTQRGNTTHNHIVGMEQCILHYDQVLQPPRQGGNRTFERNPLCVKYGPLITRLIQMVKQDHEANDAIIQAIEDLLPPKVGSRSPKRAIFSMIGKLSNSLFGTATEEQIQAVDQHVQQLANIAKGQGLAIQKSLADLSSVSKTMTDRLDNAMKIVRQNSLMAFDNFQHIVEESQDHLLFQMDIIRRGTELNHAMLGIRTYYQNFYDSMIQLTNGRLPSFLVTCEMIQWVFREIDRSLSGHPSGFQLRIRNCLKFVKETTFVYANVGHHLVITVAFPLTNKGLFDIYRLQSIDLPVPQQPNATMRLKTKEVGMAIERTARRFHFFIPAHEMALFAFKGHYDVEKQAMHKSKANICETAIFMDNHELI